MDQIAELHARLLEDAKKYDPMAHHRGLLAPYRDVLLLWRIKFMSYEQIAARLTSHGLKVSPAGVGVFCRANFTKTEIERARRGESSPPKAEPPATSCPSPAARKTTGENQSGRRGPRIARDDY